MSSFSKNLIFKGANESGELVNLAITNDIILRNNVQKVAQSFMDETLKKPDEKVASGFFHLFEKITDYISCVDLAFCNLETPLAKNLTTESSFDEDGRHVSVEKIIPDDILYYDGVYCFIPFHYLFNVHPAFALSLKNAGWNIVNTANNHSLDRLSNGIERTIESLDKYYLDYVGMVSYKKLLLHDASDAWDIKPYKIKEINGTRIAFFGITRFINKNIKQIFKSTDGENQVCNFGKGLFFSNLNGKNIPRIIKWFKHARDIDGADFIIVFAHWGFSFFDKRDGHSPDFLQRKWSKQLFDGGADLIIGGHTHTIQPGYKYVTKDGRQCFVSYSLGNFITEVKYENKLISSILYITLNKNKEGTFIKKVKYLPTYSLKKIKDSRLLDLQVVPVDKHKHLFYLYDKYNRILGKNNLITSQDIEKEYFCV